MHRPGIILASSSPRRRLLLRQIGLAFDVLPADMGEEIAPGAVPSDTVEALSLDKALLVADKLASRPDPESGGIREAMVIGSDTIVVLDGQILGKPDNADHAVAMLRSLSGRTHQVYTGVALVFGSKLADAAGLGRLPASTRNGFRHHVFHERTDVTFGLLDGDEITAYVDSGRPMDKAGAYGIQDDLGALFVERIDGDYYNVVGFPLFRFYREVNKLAPGIVTPFATVTDAS